MGGTCLIVPPADIHAVTNPFAEDALTLHVYGRDISRCSTFDLESQTAEIQELGYMNL